MMDNSFYSSGQTDISIYNIDIAMEDSPHQPDNPNSGHLKHTLENIWRESYSHMNLEKFKALILTLTPHLTASARSERQARIPSENTDLRAPRASGEAIPSELSFAYRQIELTSVQSEVRHQHIRENSKSILQEKTEQGLVKMEETILNNICLKVNQMKESILEDSDQLDYQSFYLPSIPLQIRDEIINWLDQFCTKYKLTQATFHFTVSTLDILFFREEIEKEKIRILVPAALLIAVKIYELSLKLDGKVIYGDQIVKSLLQKIQAEGKQRGKIIGVMPFIVQTLNYNMNLPTYYTSFQLYSKQWDAFINDRISYMKVKSVEFHESRQILRGIILTRKNGQFILYKTALAVLYLSALIRQQYYFQNQGNIDQFFSNFINQLRANKYLVEKNSQSFNEIFSQFLYFYHIELEDLKEQIQLLTERLEDKAFEKSFKQNATKYMKFGSPLEKTMLDQRTLENRTLTQQKEGINWSYSSIKQIYSNLRTFAQAHTDQHAPSGAQTYKFMIPPQKRGGVVDCINRTCAKLLLTQQTFHTAVAILDNFFEIDRSTKLQEIQIFAATALLISTKITQLYSRNIQNNNFSVQRQVINYFTKKGLKKTVIFELEAHILNTLKLKSIFKTFYEYFSYYSTKWDLYRRNGLPYLAGFLKIHLSQQMKQVDQFHEVSQILIGFVMKIYQGEYNISKIALAILYLILSIHTEQRFQEKLNVQAMFNIFIQQFKTRSFSIGHERHHFFNEVFERFLAPFGFRIQDLALEINLIGRSFLHLEFKYSFDSALEDYANSNENDWVKILMLACPYTSKMILHSCSA